MTVDWRVAGSMLTMRFAARSATSTRPFGARATANGSVTSTAGGSADRTGHRPAQRAHAGDVLTV
jgi:hypothetical protein